MDQTTPPSNYYNQIADLLTVIKGYTDTNTNVIWSGYQTAQDLLNDLDIKIAKVRACNYNVLEELHVLFLPTCCFQDISISNGWGDEFLVIAAEFDRLHIKIKQTQP